MHGQSKINATTPTYATSWPNFPERPHAPCLPPVPAVDAQSLPTAWLLVATAMPEMRDEKTFWVSIKVWTQHHICNGLWGTRPLLWFDLNATLELESKLDWDETCEVCQSSIRDIRSNAGRHLHDEMRFGIILRNRVSETNSGTSSRSDIRSKCQGHQRSLQPIFLLLFMRFPISSPHGTLMGLF